MTGVQTCALPIYNNFKLYERYCYSTGDVAKKLNKDAREINSFSKKQWFIDAKIDAIKMWTRLRFSEEGFQHLKEILESRKNCRNNNIYN